MKEIILNQHQQITKSLKVNKSVKVTGDFDAIILAGMGGSGHPGDLINALGLSKVPLYVHRNYDLPLAYLNNMGLLRPLVIASSYSGNTEESLSAYKAAQDQKLPLLVSAAGGTLIKWAKRDNTPYCYIDFTGMQPRHALFAAFTGIYTALRNSKLADNITKDLVRTAKVIESITPTLEDPAKKTAQAIKGKTPVFTSTDNLGFAAKNFKIQTNENAKYPAFWNTFPELNHNELLGFSKLSATNNPNKFFVLMLRDTVDHPRNKARMNVTADLYRGWGVEVKDFHVLGKTLLEKIFYAITFGLWTTYHLARLYNIDPVPVEGVEDFKAKLKEVAGSI